MYIEEPRDLEELALWFSATDPHELIHDWHSNAIAGGGLLVAYEEGSITGYVQFAGKEQGSVYIYHVRVDPHQTRRGIASRLYESILISLRPSALRALVPGNIPASIAFHDAFRRGISPESGVFRGGDWVCPSP